ncbi:MAG: hexitol phosphatase HxpB [Pleurocapsa sp.]
MIRAVIFDMDGLLIDSEPFWQQAEIAVFKEVEIFLTSEMCLQTKGLRIDEVVDYWYRRYPWNSLSKPEIEELIVTKVIELIQSQGEVMTGVNEAIAFLQNQDVQMALASSSAYRIINATLEKLGLTEAFSEVYSAEEEPFGKPHPGIYITTAYKLGVSPEDCLALEDSLNGVLAAKAAKMKCIAIPEASQLNNPQFAIADVTLSSLQDFNSNVWQSFF